MRQVLTKIHRRVMLFKMRTTGNPRPSSYPYVSGDSFRALADHIHDETSTVVPGKIRRGDIVFVSNPHTFSYLKEIHPRISQPYILIEHNGDQTIDERVLPLLDGNIFRFYAQDVTCEHEKIIPIPIGLENLHFYLNGVTSTFDWLREKIEHDPPKRKNRIFFNFNINTNPKERGPAYEFFTQHSLMETATEHLPSRIHLQKLLGYKFVASPPGHAIESCRTWEALYLKTIPIVKNFAAMRFFVSLGLPLWIVDDWRELEGLTEQDLAEKYDTFISQAKWHALHMDFWLERIRSDQQKIRHLK